MSEPAPRPWRPTKEGIALEVRLTPRGGRDAIDGIETLSDGRAVLKARVRAAPTEGEANDALIRLLAREFGLSRSRIAIVSGAAARLKTLSLHGESGPLAGLLEARLGTSRQAD
jgi:uncharacterized protein (TIGR00251 family)